MNKFYYVYILTNQTRGTLYIGVTSNLAKRVWQHKNKVLEGFTEKHDLDRLVYYESFTDINEAILKEKRMKFWKREWKIALIEKSNSKWRDLFEEIQSF